MSLTFLSLSYNLKGQSIDSENSVISFSVSNMRFNTVKGTFTGMKGTINFNPDNISGQVYPTSKSS